MSNILEVAYLSKFPRPLRFFYLLDSWTQSGCKCYFLYRKKTAGRNVFVDRHNLEVYTLHKICIRRYPGRLAWWVEPYVFLYSWCFLRLCYRNLLFRALWATGVRSCLEHSGYELYCINFLSNSDGMLRQSRWLHLFWWLQVPKQVGRSSAFGTKACDCVNEIGLSDSWMDRCLVLFALLCCSRSTKVYCTGLAPAGYLVSISSGNGRRIRLAWRLYDAIC